MIHALIKPEKYLTYIDNQNKNIENVEKIKNEFINDFFQLS